MKKTFYLLFMFIGLVFTSCEPMEDIHDEIDAEIEGKVAGTASYTLEEDDYKETLDLSFANFNNVEQAKELIPTVLEDVFPSFGAESSVNVTFDIYAPKRDEKSLIVYEATDADYDTYGDDSYANFDAMWQVFDLIEDKFADAADRTLVSLTYDYYDGGRTERNDGFLLVDGEWIYALGFTEEDYNAMGESYTNFSNEDEAEAKIPVFLAEMVKYEPAQEGTIVPVMYKIYQKDYDDIDGDGVTVDDPDTEEEEGESLEYSFVKYFIFDGANWVVYNNLLTETVQFGHDGNEWVPDNTIAYTLTNADYELVDNGKYYNFDYWDADDIQAAYNKIITILEARFPDAEVGQKFLVTYKGYNGSTNAYTAKFIVNQDGDIVLQ